MKRSVDISLNPQGPGNINPDVFGCGEHPMSFWANFFSFRSQKKLHGNDSWTFSP
jgi:hypothetical protein